jgi:putative transposase
MSKSNIILHITFSTKHRLAFINDDIESELFAYIGGICNELSSPAIIIGGYRNHVHVVCNLSRKIAVMELLEKIKKGSSKWIKTKGLKFTFFQWQKGYAAFSVSSVEMNRLIEYVKKQKEHHRKVSFESEFVSLLKKHNVDFDERYIWE